MTEQMKMRILELLRHQIPDPNLAVQNNPVVLYLEDLLVRLDGVEGQITNDLLVRIAELEGQVPAVLSIVVDPTWPVTYSYTETMAATVETQGGASAAVTWELDNIDYAGGEIAGVSINDTTGVLTVANEPALTGTTFDVVATSTFDSTVSGFASFEVAPAVLTVASSVPALNAEDVAATDVVTATFSRDVEDNTEEGVDLVDMITVTSLDGTVSDVTLASAIIAADLLTITANANFPAGTVITVTIPAEGTVAAINDGAILAADFVLTFTMMA